MTGASKLGLSRFQIDTLAVLASDPQSGASVIAELEEQYDSEIPHRRMYENLDTLEEKGLVECEENGIDGRTNRYELTEDGLVAVRVYAAKLQEHVSRVSKAYRDAGYVKNRS